MQASGLTPMSGRSSIKDVPASKARVVVLVLNWNNWIDTVDCLVSLQGLDYANVQTLVLDNGSTDGSAEHIREWFPQVEIVELGKNLGFAKGNNAGIRIAMERGAEYVWLLNNDTIVDPKALRAMVARAEADPQVGAVGSTLYYAADPECMQAWGGGYVNFWLGRSGHFRKPVSDKKIQFLTAASLLVRRATVESVGLLDEEFFLYWEDADYSFRMRRAGWKLAVAGDSRVWHKESATAGRSGTQLDTNFSRSAVRFFRANSPIPLMSIGVCAVLRLAKRALAGNWGRVQAVYVGLRR
jgi:GT2 family glycosyltransferase